MPFPAVAADLSFENVNTGSDAVVICESLVGASLTVCAVLAAELLDSFVSTRGRMRRTPSDPSPKSVGGAVDVPSQRIPSMSQSRVLSGGSVCVCVCVCVCVVRWVGGGKG